MKVTYQSLGDSGYFQLTPCSAPSGVILGAMFNSTLVLSFHDPVTAAGFNVSAGLLPGVILVSVFNQNKLLDARTLSVDRLTSMADFVGFAGMGGITRMTVATAGNPCSDFFGCYFPVIDNLSYSAVIPEPIALWVLGAGLIGVQSLRRLRSCLGRFR